MTCRFFSTAALSAVLVMPLIACEVQKSESPLSPSVAGPIKGVEITAPRPLQPAQGTKVKDSQQPLTLQVENSSTTGVRPIAYTFEVASDAEFETKVFARSGVLPGAEGRTTVTVDRLASGRGYFWRARAEDGANSSPYATSVFEILPPPQLDPPPLQSPINSAAVTTRRPALVVGMSARNAAIGNVTYEFQIAADAAFVGIVAGGSRAEAGGTTSFTPDIDLAPSTLFFWRARARDEEFTGAWSGTQSFRTPGAAPSPGPAPGPAPGGPCNFRDPQQIVECERAKYGWMSRSQMVEFLRAVARSLNRNGIGGGPYGILRKAGGNQCDGYSCDIICAGQGTAQRQHDVLGDIEGSQSPGWSAAHTYPNIRIDVCDIQ